MSWPTLRRLLGAWAALSVLILLGVRSWASLAPPKEETIVETWWKQGQRVARHIRKNGAAAPPVDSGQIDVAEEVIVGEGPLIAKSVLFELGLVAGLDGLKVVMPDGKIAYATVDDLLSWQAYDHAEAWGAVTWGTNLATIITQLAAELDAKTDDVEERGRFSRVRFERRAWRPAAGRPPDQAKLRPRVTSATLTPELVRASLHEAAQHLAKQVDLDGRFRYQIDAASNASLGGYNWPRHSGATFFLAQAAALVDDSYIKFAALRAASRLRTEMVRPCGPHRCIAEEEGNADVGSSALAVIAMTEILRAGLDTSYAPTIKELTEFLRSLQRPDGELMHIYDRTANQPIDVQYLYYSGEATLALARAHAVLGDPRDLEAAKRILSRISGASWSFFGSRYYYGEEHWTCQAVAELWDRAPDHDALTFCARWHEMQRHLQYAAGDSPFDGEGAFGFGPLVTPRVTPAASRGEAAGALLDVLLREKIAGRDPRPGEVPLVTTELRDALVFVLRNQLLPGPAYLFADPVAVRGAMPGSPVDWQLRIDYAQHAGSMMVRWLELEELAKKAGR